MRKQRLFVTGESKTVNEFVRRGKTKKERNRLQQSQHDEKETAVYRKSYLFRLLIGSFRDSSVLAVDFLWNWDWKWILEVDGGDLV
ncbi:hypothetical protein K2173_023846 [Erythroxylum novogranatense]|uniref:Uncharacterized protein n=1 Tax=Erythroxylum novogranatense TaxID=1862640 RepID=A0AAV8S5H0_9ROSI|nr:hypothetical protein K2173_023846 [Erythroxylum novogranatense]